MSHETMQLVIKIGGEGGSLSLFACESQTKPRYVLAIVDQSLLIIGEGDVIEGERGKATSWRGALRLLDRYPWGMLYPLKVHPDYRDRVLNAVKRRLAKRDEWYAERSLERWRAVCQGEEE